VLLGTLLTESISSYEKIQKWSENTLEKQATVFLLQGVEPTASEMEYQRSIEHSTSEVAKLFRRTRSEIVEERTACQNIIRKYATIDGKSVTKIDPTGIPDLIKAPCFFIDSSVRLNIWELVSFGRALFNSAVAITVVFVVVFSVLWSFGYSHIGWRRLSIVTAVLLGTATGSIQWLSSENIPATFLVALVVSALLCPLILVGRELYLWIAKGFAAEKEP